MLSRVSRSAVGERGESPRATLGADPGVPSSSLAEGLVWKTQRPHRRRGNEGSNSRRIPKGEEEEEEDQQEERERESEEEEEEEESR